MMSILEYVDGQDWLLLAAGIFAIVIGLSAKTFYWSSEDDSDEKSPAPTRIGKAAFLGVGAAMIAIMLGRLYLAISGEAQ